MAQTLVCPSCGKINRSSAKFCAYCRAPLLSSPTWDVFISHASEDTDAVARPLAQALEQRGLKVWLDENTLSVGDSLRRQIDRGLANSRFGVVILSPDFFRKNWPQMELDALVARDDGKEKVILPVWHHLTAEQVARYSPLVAGKLAVSTAQGIEKVANEIMRGMGRAMPHTAPSDLYKRRLGAIRQQLLLAQSSWDLQRLAREVEAFLHDYPGNAVALQLKDQIAAALRAQARIHPGTGGRMPSQGALPRERGIRIPTTFARILGAGAGALVFSCIVANIAFPLIVTNRGMSIALATTPTRTYVATTETPISFLSPTIMIIAPKVIIVPPTATRFSVSPIPSPTGTPSPGWSVLTLIDTPTPRPSSTPTFMPTATETAMPTSTPTRTTLPSATPTPTPIAATERLLATGIWCILPTALLLLVASIGVMFLLVRQGYVRIG